MKKAFDALIEGKGIDIETHYLYATRRAIIISSITKLDKRVVEYILEGPTMAVSEFLKRIGLVGSEHEEKIKACGFSSSKRKICPRGFANDYNKLKELIYKLEDEIIEAAKREREIYGEYLEGIGMLGEDKIGLVDIGWYGTIQNYFLDLLKLYDREPEIYGFFLGLFRPKKTVNNFREKSKGYGYLLHYEDVDCDGYLDYYKGHSLIEYVRVVELLFSAPEKTFIKMVKNEKGEIEPVFDESSTSEYTSFIGRIQEEAMDFLREFANVDKERLPVLNRKVIRVLLYELFKSPYYTEARNLGGVVNDMDLGTKTHGYLARPKYRAVEYLKNPLKLKEDSQGAFWRWGFYKQQPFWVKGMLKLLVPKFWKEDGWVSKFYQKYYREAKDRLQKKGRK